MSFSTRDEFLVRLTSKSEKKKVYAPVVGPAVGASTIALSP